MADIEATFAVGGGSQSAIRAVIESVRALVGEWCAVTFEHSEEHTKGRKNRLAP